jgi:hypothetical protein
VLGYTLSELSALQIELERDERSRCSLYVHTAGTDLHFRADVPASDREALADAARAGERFETYVAAEPFPPTVWPDAQLVDGVALIGDRSRAWSVRESGRAAECAVETAEPHRQHGLARQVTAAWATSVLARGKVPFYSHRAGNDASRALAESLGLAHVFTVYTA